MLCLISALLKNSIVEGNAYSAVHSAPVYIRIAPLVPVAATSVKSFSVLAPSVIPYPDNVVGVLLRSVHDPEVAIAASPVTLLALSATLSQVLPLHCRT